MGVGPAICALTGLQVILTHTQVQKPVLPTILATEKGKDEIVIFFL